MPVRTTPEQAANKWRDRLTGSTQQISDGVDRVTQAPGEKAANSRALWARKTAEAADKWERNTRRVSLEDWRRKMKDVGIARISQGASANTDKVASFMSDFLPHLARGVETVEKMPKGTIEDSINRSAAMIRHNASFKRSS